VDDVVSEAGFARGTFYKYFDEKLDLLLELTRECDAEMRVLVEEFLLIEPSSPAGPEQLRGWLGRYLPFHSRYLGIMRAWLEGTSATRRCSPWSGRRGTTCTSHPWRCSAASSGRTRST
jgi:AcrR family transcriptional regulator